jgi:hypothetical protein
MVQRKFAQAGQLRTRQISRIRSLVAILQNHGILVEMLTTDRVGYIAYQDEFQIVAEPFADF